MENGSNIFGKQGLLQGFLVENDLFLKIQKAIVELDEQILNTLTEEVMEAGVNPLEAIDKGYTVGIAKVGKLFETGDYFLPELIYAATMVKEAVTKVEKLIGHSEVIHEGKIVLGTVSGDIHDIQDRERGYPRPRSQNRYSQPKACPED